VNVKTVMGIWFFGLEVLSNFFFIIYLNLKHDFLLANLKHVKIVVEILNT